MRISSEIQDLDNVLGGLLAGDNVVWVTTSQGVVAAIEQAFVAEGRRRDEPCTYVTTESAPASLRAKLGAGLRILDARPGRPLADATALETRIVDDARQDPGGL